MDDRVVSICIGAYNSAPTIAEAIESALGQTGVTVEVLVVDDGSADATFDVARSFGDRVVARRADHLGSSASRNAAIALATGTHLTFLDADDRLRPGAIAALLRGFDGDHTADAVFGRMVEFADGAAIGAEGRPLRQPDGAPVATRLPATMLITRAAFDRVGPFDATFARANSIEWVSRLVDADLRTVHIEDVVFERRIHSKSLGARHPELDGDMVRAVRAALERRRRAP